MLPDHVRTPIGTFERARQRLRETPSVESKKRGTGLDPRTLVTTPEGIRQAWSIIEERWESTFERVTGLPESMLHERVNDEWSFVETQRHLLFAADVWLRRDAVGDAHQWHRLGMPPDLRTGQPDPNNAVERWGIDVFATPSCAEVLAVRREYLSLVRELADRLTPEELNRPTSCNPPWIPATTPVQMRSCFGVVIREEWEHHGFATRDLAVLEQSP